MEFNTAHIIYFSPTSTSKQVATSIVHGTGIENVSVINLTYKQPGETCINPDTLVIIAVPVYGGHVAPLALKRMEHIKGNNTPVVLVTVYGNRAYEKSLIELDIFAKNNGFKVIAAATFVGEHSYSNKEHPVSLGRPDKNDFDFAQRFGQEIANKILSATSDDELYPVDVSSIKRPSQPLFPLLGFLWKMIQLRKSGVTSPISPDTNSERCIHCGACVKLCPNKAITAGDELNTIAARCIRCCACVKGCPTNARSLEPPIARLLARYFKKQKSPQKLI